MTLKQKFAALSTRERVIVIGGAVLVVIVAIYMLALSPFYRALDARAERLERKQVDLSWMHSVAPELQSSGGAMPAAAAPTGESLVVLVDRTAREGNLASALTGQTPTGNGGIRVRFENANFDTLVLWMGSLVQRHGVYIDQATLDRGEKPGLVNASFVLTRAGA
ncbi:MAG: type II secretion system protein M [Steroidobacteraceae bacterium]